MSRYASWLAIAIAAAFLVVASAAFSPSTTKWLAFAISIGTLGVSAVVAYATRGEVVSRVGSVLIAVVSAWTVVASQVFSQGTVQDLVLASSLVISGLAVVGLTAHELAHERAEQSIDESAADHKTRLAAAG